MEPEKVRLNNFILWCKGWYQPVNEDDVLNDARKILTLDGYLSCNPYTEEQYDFETEECEMFKPIE